MFCPNCGANLPDGLNFCTSCGSQMSAPSAQPAPESYQQPPQPTRPSYNPVYTQAPVGPSMGWFKFLIYFVLFASGVLNIVNGFSYLTGSQYEEYADFIYAAIDSLQTVDVLVGIMMLAAGALAIFTRFQLSGYKANGPKFLLAVYAANAVINLVYFIGLNAVFSDFGSYADLILGDTYTSIFVSIAVSVVMIFVNRTYFKNREQMFVN